MKSTKPPDKSRRAAPSKKAAPYSAKTPLNVPLDELGVKPTRFDRALQYCDSYSRLPTLLELAGMYAGTREWFRALGSEWTCCDNISRFADDLDFHFMHATSDHLREMMAPYEREIWESMPESITAYRGCYDINLDGFSYTLDIEQAKRFPTLARYGRLGERPILRVVKIDKASTVLKLGRNEAEVIIAYRENIEVIAEIRGTRTRINPSNSALMTRFPKAA